MRVVVEASDLPGSSCSAKDGNAWKNVHVGVQQKKEVVDLVSGDAETANWEFDVEVKDDGDIKGPHVQGKKGDRFFYLSWVVVDGTAHTMFRRAKLMVDGVPAKVWSDAQRSGTLIGSLGLTMKDGSPLCAAVRPPTITWIAG